MCRSGEHSHEHHGTHEHHASRGGPTRRTFLASIGAVLTALRLYAQTKPSVNSRADRSLAEAAENFLKALRPELRARYAFAFDDEPYRKDWNNLPSFVHPRKGLRMGDLNPAE